MSTFFGLKAKPYPFDPSAVGSTPWDTLSAPFPEYPKDDKLFEKVFPPVIFYKSLSPWLPLGFSLAYYIIAHAANGIVKRNGSKDFTKGKGFFARILRFLILVHNAALAVYSGWTWAMMFPLVVDFFIQGWRSAGFDGVKLALCSVPTNYAHLGKYAYIFYISKYYEVVDSVILLVKGKRVSNLQSYHHAGAIICMWIAYRYQSQPVWGKCSLVSCLACLLVSDLIFALVPGLLRTSLLRVQQLCPHLDVHLLLLRRHAMALPACSQAKPHHDANRTDCFRHLPHQSLSPHHTQLRKGGGRLQGQQSLILVFIDPRSVPSNARSQSRCFVRPRHLHADHGR